MARFYVDDEHLQAWREAHESWTTESEMSKTFADALERMPWDWAGLRLNWSALGGLVIDLANIEQEPDLGRCRLTGFSHVFLLYSPDQPGLIARTSDVLSSLDELYWRAPGRRYLCGVDMYEGRVPVLAYDAVAEYDPVGTLTLRTCAPSATGGHLV